MDLSGLAVAEWAPRQVLSLIIALKMMYTAPHVEGMKTKHAGEQNTPTTVEDNLVWTFEEGFRTAESEARKR